MYLAQKKIFSLEFVNRKSEWTSMALRHPVLAGVGSAQVVANSGRTQIELTKRRMETTVK